MNRLSWGVVAVVVLLALVSAPTVAADEFEGYVEDPILEPGEEQTVAVEIEYTAQEDDPTANVSGVTAELDVADDNIDVLSAEQHVTSTMTDGSTQTVVFDIAVSDSISSGIVPADVTVQYEDSQVQEIPVQFEVPDRARFDGTVLESSLQPDTTRDVSVEVTNTGQERAEEAVVRFTTSDADIQLFPDDPDGVEVIEDEATPGSAAEVYIGAWTEGADQIIDVPVYVADDTPPQEITIRAVVEFEDPMGIDRQSDEIVFGADVLEDQQFSLSVDHDESGVRVGETGTVDVSITNHGDHDVTNLMLRPATENVDDLPVFDGEDGIYLTEDHVFEPDLTAGDTLETSIQVSASDEVEPGWQVLPMELRYRGLDGAIQTSDVLDMPVDIDPERDEFALDISEAAVDRGESDRIELTVTNQLDESVSDIQAQLYTDDPLASDDDQAFIQELSADESTTVTFDIEATENAGEKTYPARIDFQYEDSDGDTQLSDVYRIPVDVDESSTNWLQVGLLIGGLLIVGAGAAVRYTDRLQSYVPRLSAESSEQTQSDPDSTSEE